MKPILIRLEDGSVELRAWPVWAMQVLDELVVLADPSTPRGPARERLFPVATDDPAEAEEWRSSMHPELFALFAASHAIVRDDIAKAERGPRGRLRRLVIPADHVPAWISALQTARIHLAEAFGIGADEMSGEPDAVRDDLRGVVVRIDLMGSLQGTLLDARGDAPPPPGADCSGDDDGS